MHKLIWLLVVMSGSLFVAAPASSAEKLRMSVPAPDPATRAFVETLQKSPQLAAADIQIELLPAGALAAPHEAADLLRQKIIDLALLPHSFIAPRPSDGFAISLLGNPATITDVREQFAIQDSPYKDSIAAEIGRQKLVTLAYWNRSPSIILVRRPVKSWDDLKGRTIAAFDPGSRKFLFAMGATPTPLVAGEIFSALEKGVVDAAEVGTATSTGWTVLESFQGGTAIANFRHPLGFLLAHQDLWLRITQRQRRALTKAAKDAEAAARQVVLAEQERLSSIASDKKIQLVSFEQLGKLSPDTDAVAVWLKEAGDGGQSAVDLLAKVRLDLRAPKLPQRGGEVTAPVKILFSTIRNDEKEPDLAERFGIRRELGQPLSCGAVAFVLPAARKIGEAYTGPISVQSGTLVLTDADCHKMIGGAAEKAGGNLAIYLHGFNNSMEFALQRAIGFAHDVKLSAPLMVWSWPSANNPSMYDYDEDSVRWSRIHLQGLIRTLASDARIKRIAVISHSMGGRLACDVLETAASLPRKDVLGDLVFTAPDVVTSELSQTVHMFGAAAQRISLYATENDLALWYSETFYHKAPIAGRGGARVLILPKVETIDATEVEAGVPNHAYAFEVGEVVADLRVLLSDDRGAASRALKKSPKNGSFYWMVQKRGSGSE